ncbi:type II secretion system secretin GspD [Oceanibacterium hippocampi]|uniref:Type II secretion system protein D n=1 Tax=Oceanibacterium hippocampi TaxID=745714 RepID=A0A1Y5TBR7_9PROT|nr:type II secretion system secretin GspD [Oceanibacterium hippocampi]SLN56801.1 Type II secretion system protein D precursor [Oceanibacterium hippocampi]
MRARLPLLVMVGLSLALTGCSVKQKRPVAATPAAATATASPAVQPRPSAMVPSVPGQNSIAAADAANSTVETGKIAELYPAEGERIDLAKAGRGGGGGLARGDINLSFQDASIREVAQVILGDLLDQSYVIDPRVDGRVTFESGRPVARSALIPALEAALAASGAAMELSGGVYRIVPRAEARAGIGPRLSIDQGAGYSLLVVPLDFIGAGEMAKILEPLLREGQIAYTDTQRNLLILAAPGPELRLARETVDIFDINQMAGHSVLLETLQNADVGDLVIELENVFGGSKSGPLAGLVRFVPIERMNAILVISRQPEYLSEARNWIARLDRTRSATERRLFVYYVQNGKASSIANTLRAVFEERGAPVTLSEADGAAERALTEPDALTPVSAAAPRDGGNIRIIADESNNAVLVQATSREYRIIEEVLAKLDIVPLQVLIDVKIVEVTLTDGLRFGVQYFLKGDAGRTDSQTVLRNDESSGPLSTAIRGFSFALLRNGDPRIILDALSELTSLNMVAAPQLMVLDNQPAKLQVGDQVPILTQFSSGLDQADTRQVNSVEYRETGVTLEVTPRVNASGLVTLEIAQEVSQAVPTTVANIDSPTISRRSFLTTVAVNDTSTLVLGGLIRESAEDGDSGIPVLHRLPLVGNLFGSRSTNITRTELLVLISPRVIRNERQANDVTQEMRQRFQAVLALENRGVEQPRTPKKPGQLD